MPKKRPVAEPQFPEPPIFVIRGQRVILDADLARIYGVSTKRFNEAIKRNRQRFPDDFAFQLTASEVASLRVQSSRVSQVVADAEVTQNSSQIVMSSPQAVTGKRDRANSSQFVMSSTQVVTGQEDTANWSQFVTSSTRRGAAYRPWAFTEHGALMAANVLRSRAGRGDERLRGAGIRAAAGTDRGQRGNPQTAGGN